MADAVQYGWIKYLFKKQLWPKAVNMLTAVLYIAILKKQGRPNISTEVAKASGSESSSSSSSRQAKEKTSSAATGRRAKREMKREAANRAAEVVAAAKHEALLVRLGRK